MNRLKIIAHKWYVMFVTFKHVVQFLYNVTERIAGFKITVITENDLQNEQLHETMQDEETAEMDAKDLN